MRKATPGKFLLASMLAGGCGGGGPGEVIVLNPGDGLPSETFQGMDVADLNNDGLPDIVSAGYLFDGVGSFEHRLSVFLQDPSQPGRFLPRTFVVHDEGESVWQVIVADLALDGSPEVLTKSIAFAGFSVFEQDPAAPGTFLAPRRTGTAGQFNPNSFDRFDVGDVDGDFYPDVVMTAGNDVLYFRQDAAVPGTFEPVVRAGEGASDIRIADVDGDGLSDLVTFATRPDRDNHEIRDIWHLHRQDSSAPGSFLAPVIGLLDSVGWALEVDDLSNDGYVDIAVNSANANSEFLIVFRQTPFDTFERLKPVATGLDAVLGDMVVADLENDGLSEIVSAMNTGAVDPNVIQIYRQDNGAVYRTDGVLDIPYPPVGQPFIYALEVTDMNGDDQPDIVVCSGEIVIFFQRGGSPGTFDPPTIVAAKR